MSNIIVITKNWKEATDKTSGKFKELTFITPKNVSDNNYFQLACQYHCFVVGESWQAGQINIMSNTIENLHSKVSLTDKERMQLNELESNLEKLSKQHETYNNMFQKFVENVNKVSLLIETIKTDIFAQFYICTRLNMTYTSGNKVEYKENGDIIYHKEYISSYDKWADITRRTRDLHNIICKDNPTKKDKETVMLPIIEIMNDYIKDCYGNDSIQSKYYKNINFNKITWKYISMYYSTVAEWRNGKNGGIIYNLKNFHVLLFCLANTMYTWLGCQELQNKESAFTSNELAVNELINVNNKNTEEKNDQN